MAQVQSSMDFLKSYTQSATGVALKNADQNMGQLQQLTNAHLSLMAQQTQTQMDALSSSITQGSATATAQATGYWIKYQGTVQDAVKALLPQLPDKEVETVGSAIVAIRKAG